MYLIRAITLIGQYPLFTYCLDYPAQQWHFTLRLAELLSQQVTIKVSALWRQNCLDLVTSYVGAEWY